MNYEEKWMVKNYYNYWLQVLDAPSLQDDFYLNLVDWSSQNVLAVGLGTCVYLWSASNSKVKSEKNCYREQFHYLMILFYFYELTFG